MAEALSAGGTRWPFPQEGLRRPSRGATSPSGRPSARRHRGRRHQLRVGCRPLGGTGSHASRASTCSTHQGESRRSPRRASGANRAHGTHAVSPHLGGVDGHGLVVADPADVDRAHLVLDDPTHLGAVGEPGSTRRRSPTTSPSSSRARRRTAAGRLSPGRGGRRPSSSTAPGTWPWLRPGASAAARPRRRTGRPRTQGAAACERGTSLLGAVPIARPPSSSSTTSSGDW